METEERGRWERGEEGHWHTLCGMMRRARGMLDDARKAGEGILPPEMLKEKKSLGKMGTEFEPSRAQPDAAKPKESSTSASDSSSDSETDMSDPDSEAEDTKVAPAPEFVPIVAGKKRKLGSDDREDDASNIAQAEVEPNPYFVVDTEPTPVAPPKEKKIKKAKKSKDEGEELVEKKSKKHKKSEVIPVTASNPVADEVKDEAKSEAVQRKVDFAAIERQLQADVEARMRAKEAEDAADAQKPDVDGAESSTKEKKRKRISNGSEVVETKKVKKDKKDKDKKRKAAGEDSGSKKRKVGADEDDA